MLTDAAYARQFTTHPATTDVPTVRVQSLVGVPAKLLDAVEGLIDAIDDVSKIKLQRGTDERKHAAAGMTYSQSDLSAAEIHASICTNRVRKLLPPKA